MRNCINIKANNIPFKYLLEYSKGNNENTIIKGNNIKFYKTGTDIKLFKYDIQYYRNKNDWYNIENIHSYLNINSNIPTSVKTTKLKIYIPN